MTKLKLFRALLLLSIIIASCTYMGKQKLDDAIEIEYKKVNVEARKVEVGDKITIHMIHAIGDSIAKNTYLSRPIEIVVTAPEFVGDLMRAFSHLHKGDSVFIQLDKQQYFKNSGIDEPAFLNHISTLDYTIKVLDITPAKELHEASKKEHQSLIKQEVMYIKNHIDTLDIKYYSTRSLLFYHIIKSNKKGKCIQNGDTVTAHCKGSLLKGAIFDNTFDQNTPYQFIVGESQLIFGLQEAMSLMKEGEHLRFFIPSYLAYGSGKIEMGDLTIPANSPLEYEIEILNVSRR